MPGRAQVINDAVLHWATQSAHSYEEINNILVGMLLSEADMGIALSKFRYFMPKAIELSAVRSLDLTYAFRLLQRDELPKSPTMPMPRVVGNGAMWFADGLDALEAWLRAHSLVTSLFMLALITALLWALVVLT